MKTAVIVFPGSAGQRELASAFTQTMGQAPIMVWHEDTELPAGLDVIGLPDGSSFGHYLRPGAIAARSPVMHAVAEAAAKGISVLGIGNGFQILTEAGLLPGALMQNAKLDFICRNVEIEVGDMPDRFAGKLQKGQRITLPIAHQHGNFQADEATLDELEQSGRIAFRYATDVNGSARNIAGITDDKGHVLGLMPQPELATQDAHGNLDGLLLLESLSGATV